MFIKANIICELSKHVLMISYSILIREFDRPGIIVSICSIYIVASLCDIIICLLLSLSIFTSVFYSIVYARMGILYKLPATATAMGCNDGMWQNIDTMNVGTVLVHGSSTI